MNNQKELGNAITTSIGIMASENSLQLVQLLQESGNSVDASASQQELLEAAFRALKNSASFRDKLANYLSAEAISSDANYGNYVEDGFFNNFTNPFDNYTAKSNRGFYNNFTNPFSSSSSVGNFVGSKIATLANNPSKSANGYSSFVGDTNFF